MLIRCIQALPYSEAASDEFNIQGLPLQYFWGSHIDLKYLFSQVKVNLKISSPLLLTLPWSQNEQSIWSILFSRTWKSLLQNSWQFGEAHPATFATMVWSLPVVIWISVPGTCSSFRHHGLITSCCDLDLGARWDFSNLPTTNPYVLISVMINFFQRQNPLVVCIDQGSNTLSLINIKLVLGCFYIQVYSWVWIRYLVNKLSIPHAPIFYLSSITA